ncbi:MAG TPA: hypothetical protein VGC40_07095 [Paenirhodobacter sp.]
MKSVPLLVLAGLLAAGCSQQGAGSDNSYQSYLRTHSTGTAPARQPVIADTGGYGSDAAAAGLGAPDQPVASGSIGADTLAALKATAPTSNFMADDAQTASATVQSVPAYAGSVQAAGRSDAISGPNLAAYALSATQAPGQAIYPRGGFHLTSMARACAKFTSADRAQIAFLEKGGPQTDKLNLDPDGDGFACGWDPRPFQLARQ